MKNKKFIFVSLITTVLYLGYILLKYGLLPSISHSAEYEPTLFIIFILLMAWPLAIVAWSPITWVAAAVLSLIGFWTGYNPDLFNDNIESKLHVVFTMTGILLVLLDMVVKGFQNKKFLEDSIFWVGGFGLFATISFLLKYPSHTYLIEVACLTIVMIYLSCYEHPEK